MVNVHTTFLLLSAFPIGQATNSSMDECNANARPVAGSIFESIRLRGGATSEETDKGPMILILGDSNAEFSGTSLNNFCRGCTVLNKGIGGTMTPDWGMAKIMEVAQSLPEGFVPTHVWLSIGGNDYMERHNCQDSLADQLQAEITEVGSNLRSVLPPEVQILMTAYAQSTNEICDFRASHRRAPQLGSNSHQSRPRQLKRLAPSSSPPWKPLVGALRRHSHPSRRRRTRTLSICRTRDTAASLRTTPSKASLAARMASPLTARTCRSCQSQELAQPFTARRAQGTREIVQRRESR